jgi:hypothetical protein
MTRKWRSGLCIGSFSVLAVVGLLHAALAANSTPVTVTFGSGFSNNQIGTGGDQIGSDSASNLTYNNGGAVEVDFSSGGNLQFDTDLHSQSGGRQLAVAFENPTGKGCATPCPSPPGGGSKAVLVDAFMSTGHVTLADGTFVFGLREMPDPSNGFTDLSINFPGWFVRYSPSSWPLSTQVNVSRSGNIWTITAASPQAAQLIKLTNNGKTETPAGTFVMPTEITITCPSC